MAVKFEHRIGVAAPAELIWEILVDVPAWPTWAPIYTQAAGQVKFGDKLTLTQVLPGEAERVIEPVILDWAPNEAIHWRHSTHYGLVKTVRYLEIEKLSEVGCAFSNGELFDGFIGVRVARHRRKPLHRGFTALGEALKVHAEALWARRQGEGAS